MLGGKERARWSMCSMPNGVSQWTMWPAVAMGGWRGLGVSVSCGAVHVRAQCTGVREIGAIKDGIIGGTVQEIKHVTGIYADREVLV